MDTFKYLGVNVNSQSDEHVEIKNRLILANRSMYALNSILKSKILSRNTKLKVYKTVIRPVLLYGAETWIIDKSTEKKLITFENKVLRRIFGPTKEGNIWRIKHNWEIRELFKEPDVVAEAKSRRLRWAGHVMRRDESSMLYQIWNSNPIGSRPRGRPKIRWKDQVKKDMAKLRATEEHARDRSLWRHFVGEAKYHLGYQWPWK